MTLEELFPILLQYAPTMLSALQNRGYDPGVMANNANDLTKYWYGESLPSFAERTDDPTMMDLIGALDRNIGYTLKDSDNPNNEFNDLFPHVPEYSLGDLTPLEEDDIGDYFANDPNKLNALGYAKQMFNKNNRRI